MGRRINTVMQPCFFALSGVLPTGRRRWPPSGLVDRGAPTPRPVRPSSSGTWPRSTPRSARCTRCPFRPRRRPRRVDRPACAGHRPDFVERVTARLLAGEGDLLPVSALPVDGTFPTGTARWEKRALAAELPVWEPTLCIDCGKCALVCPHAAIRMKVVRRPTALRRRARRLQGQGLPLPRPARAPPDDPGGARRLHRLRRLRPGVPGQGEGRGEAQGVEHGARR